MRELTPEAPDQIPDPRAKTGREMWISDGTDRDEGRRAARPERERGPGAL